MIDAKAVWAGVAQGGGAVGATEWMRTAVAGTALSYGEDAAGNARVSLAGGGERTLMLGSSVAQGMEGAEEARHFGLVVGVEVLKALGRKFAGAPPCAVVFQSRAEDRSDQQGPSAADGVPATAYLELQVVGPMVATEAALGLITSGAAGEEPVGLNSRLLVLGEEAVDELAGVSTAITAELSETLTGMARAGVPSAAMFVRYAPAAEGASLPDGERLQLLQAAEAFGRWAEATMHLVAGDEVHLWALEHRVPHS